MKQIEFERAYKVHATEGGEIVVPAFVAVGVVGGYVSTGHDSIRMQWTMTTNTEEGAYTFFGEPLRVEGDVFVFDDTAARARGEERRVYFEPLTWERMEGLGIAGADKLKAFAPDDSGLQDFFLQSYLDDDAQASTNSAQMMWIESEDAGPRLMGLHELLEAQGAKKKKLKRGFPVGTIHRWSDGFDYEKHEDGMWRRVVGQKDAGASPPVEAHPLAVAAELVLPIAEDGWRKVSAVPWLPTSSALEHFTFSKSGDLSKMKPNAERKKLHTQIMKRAFTGKTSVPKNLGPVALVTMGTPASGKSTVVDELLAAAGEVTDHDNFVRCDPDLFKTQLPEYNEALQAKCEDAAQIVHTESSYINDRIFDKAIHGNHNLVFDGVGKQYEYYQKDVVGRLKQAGYHVILLMPFIESADEAVGRAKDRQRRNGRKVEEEYIRAVHPVIPKNFKKLMREVDEFQLFTVADRKARVAFRGTGGSSENDEVVDEEAYKKFLSMSEAVALMLMKLVTESSSPGYSAPAKPPAVPYDSAVAMWLRELHRTEEVLASLPPRYTETMGVNWPVGEPTAGTSGRPVEDDEAGE